MTAADAHRAILAAWRVEQPRLITSLARMLRDVPLAEELTQDALLAWEGPLGHSPVKGLLSSPIPTEIAREIRSLPDPKRA